MRATPVDPRDQRWQDDRPTYRVHFWTGSAASDEWQVTEADVDEVLAWADEHARGRTMSIWVVTSGPEGVGLIRLAGLDPTTDPSSWPPSAATRRAP